MARYDIDPKFVLSQRFEDEVILINLREGTYYSLTGVAADVWSGLESGGSDADVVGQLCGAWSGDREEIGRETRRFIEELCGEGLVALAGNIPGASSGAVSEAAVAPIAVAVAVAKADVGSRRFEPPKLERYADMQDLLLLDPVHDVDAAGHPLPLKATNH